MAYKAHYGQYRKSGEPYIAHPLCVAILLAEMELDRECILAGLLHDIIEENTPIKLEHVATEISNETAQLIEHVTYFSPTSWNEKNIDDYIIEYRVILIKLADRLHNMRTMKYMESEKLREKAKETIELFSPLAARLGISKIKTELDDLSLIYLGK